MFTANTFRIREATDADAAAIRRLAQLDSGTPMTGRALIGEIDGKPAAALSLDDGRVIADPFVRTVHLVSLMRTRADALRPEVVRTPRADHLLRGSVFGSAMA